MSPVEKIETLRAAFLLAPDLTRAFFATLLLRLEFIATDLIPTMATDGRRVFYSPAFVDRSEMAHLEFVLAHEVLHVVQDHHGRLEWCDDMDAKNRAADLAANDRLVDAGLTPPPGALIPGRGEYTMIDRGLSAEEYLAILLAQSRDGGDPSPSGGESGDEGDPSSDQGQGGDSSDGDSSGGDSSQEDGPPEGGQDSAPGEPSTGDDRGSGSAENAPETASSGDLGGGSAEADLRRATDPGGCGTFLPTRLDAEGRASMEVAVLQAARRVREAAEEAGAEVPALVGEILRDLQHAVQPWQEILRDYLADRAKNDYSWARPNRRSLGSGVILPGMYSDELGEVVVSIDTSGSMSSEQVAACLQEVEDLLAAYDCRATVLFHHARIWTEIEWEPSDGPLVPPKKIESGGTSHVDVMARVEELDPVLFLGFTDGITRFDPARAEPDCGVVWVMPKSRRDPPFGRVIEMEGAS